MTAISPAETARQAPSGSGGRFRRALAAGADLRTYLAYLAVAILSEIVTQVVGGWHQVRITMMSVSLLVAGYLWMRRGALRSGW